MWPFPFGPALQPDTHAPSPLKVDSWEARLKSDQVF